MVIKTGTTRRWLLSVLRSVAVTQEPQCNARAAVRATGHSGATKHGNFALRLKAATRPLTKVSG